MTRYRPRELLPTAGGDMTTVRDLSTSWVKSTSSTHHVSRTETTLEVGSESGLGMLSSLPYSTTRRGLWEQGLPEVS